MSILVSLVCALCITSTHGFHMFFDDAEPSYNPCDSKPDVYFYAHPTDINKYYQCDAEGNPYLRSCGTLVWDELSISCNWATSVTLTTTQPSLIITTTTTTTTTTAKTSLFSTTRLRTTSTASSVSLSLCKPVNPCGDHGECLESPLSVPAASRRFACLCDEDWFGKLCDERIDSLTTPAAPSLDQVKANSSSTNSFFSLPIQSETDSQVISLGLKSYKMISRPRYIERRSAEPIVDELD